MGADLLVDGILLPESGTLNCNAARAAVLALTNAELHSFDADQCLPHITDSEGDDAVGEDGALTAAGIAHRRGVLLRAIDDVEEMIAGETRGAGVFRFSDGTREVALLLTGGMSWGESPTDEFDTVGLVLACTSIYDALMAPTTELRADTISG